MRLETSTNNTVLVNIGKKTDRLTDLGVNRKIILKMYPCKTTYGGGFL